MGYVNEMIVEIVEKNHSRYPCVKDFVLFANLPEVMEYCRKNFEQSQKDIKNFYEKCKIKPTRERPKEYPITSNYLDLHF